MGLAGPPRTRGVLPTCRSLAPCYKRRVHRWAPFVSHQNHRGSANGVSCAESDRQGHAARRHARVSGRVLCQPRAQGCGGPGGRGGPHSTPGHPAVKGGWGCLKDGASCSQGRLGTPTTRPFLKMTVKDRGATRIFRRSQRAVCRHCVHSPLAALQPLSPLPFFIPSAFPPDPPCPFPLVD